MKGNDNVVDTFDLDYQNQTTTNNQIHSGLNFHVETERQPLELSNQSDIGGAGGFVSVRGWGGPTKESMRAGCGGTLEGTKEGTTSTKREGDYFRGLEAT